MDITKQYKFVVEKYCGRIYCGNAFCKTIDECLIFARDEFCDECKILNLETGEKKKIKITY